MAITTPTKTAWSAAGAPGAVMQVRGGRLLLATSNTPAEQDWIVLFEGAVLELQSAKFVRAVDDGAFCVWQVL